MSKSSSSNGGIGFTGLLTVAFVVLKLTKVIDWSWWWVLSPIWIAAALSFAIIAAVLLLRR
ncbi:hypothetical protein QEG46_003956 [Stenotrophomonas maltophilia]|uniref:hypothetical protein n=1 Tax=Stenotrophomonas maltophilia TaxID=40324 RepID=UPI0021C57081|nr:hypothetical protein [Stenotrophomonas maltophilia]EKT4107934.1 hypothetical protein [Stenotrophomonas maltophilia]MCU1053291.1 hypothetical protein [Stenotrophomonas maltophilia]